MSRDIELGSGEVESDPGKPIIHFGSPTGAAFGEGGTQ